MNPKYNPQKASTKRRFHCRLCPYTSRKLGDLRAHHFEKHPVTYGSTPNNQQKRLRVLRKQGGAEGLPTIPRSATTPTVGGGTRLNFCPNCGHQLRRYR